MNIVYIACAIIFLAWFVQFFVSFIWIGVFGFIKKKRYGRALLNIAAIAFAALIMYWADYFKWARNAVEIIWSIFN